MFHALSTSELLSSLDESQIVLTTLLTNRHHHPFAAELVQWNRWLSVIRDVLEPTLAAQSSLLYVNLPLMT